MKRENHAPQRPGEDAPEERHGSGLLVFAAVLLVVLLLAQLCGLDTEVPYVPLWCLIASGAYRKYRSTRKRSYLVSAVAGIIIAAVFLLRFLTGFLW